MTSAGRLCIVRRGHMGDVIISEPIARALRPSYSSITLCTEFTKVGRLLDVYSEILPYESFLTGELSGFDRILELVYEIYPGCNHLDGYARFAGVGLVDRLPRVRQGSDPLVKEAYGLIAPHTSSFIQNMRQWPISRFRLLRIRLEEVLGIPFFFLDPNHSFEEMIRLCEHSACFVGNDSGPAILSQCFGRPTFVVFGATHPNLVLLHPEAVPLKSDVGCNGCKHWARHTDIECNSPICLHTLSVEMALEQIIARL